MYLQAVTPETQERAFVIYRKFGYPERELAKLTAYVMMEDGHVVSNKLGRFRIVVLSDDEAKQALKKHEYEKIITDPLIDLESWDEGNE